MKKVLTTIALGGMIITCVALPGMAQVLLLFKPKSKCLRPGAGGDGGDTLKKRSGPGIKKTFITERFFAGQGFLELPLKLNGLAKQLL